jgi:hypothetical protein
LFEQEKVVKSTNGPCHLNTGYHLVEAREDYHRGHQLELRLYRREMRENDQ